MPAGFRSAGGVAAASEVAPAGTCTSGSVGSCAGASAITPREYIFVVDISGSMHGFPLETAKVLLRELIGGLKPSDSFNVNPSFVRTQPCQMLEKHRILTGKWEKSSLQRLRAVVSSPDS